MPKTRSSGRRPKVLVGDVGGTHARLVIHELGRSAPLASVDAESRKYASLESIAAPFAAASGFKIDLAVIGVAGPVEDGVATTTNLPWRVDERVLAKALGVRRVVLMNDLVVAARGCLDLESDDLVALTPMLPRPKGKPCAVIAAGTGLGEARLLWTGKSHIALPAEGGHSDFAARSPLEIELWQFLHARHKDHVSYERVVCGAGIGALYDFFASRAPREPKRVTRLLAEGDRNAAIAELGLSRASRPAARAIDLFASIYGAEAGNLALHEIATGGVFVVGSIARKVVPARREIFLEAFVKKGRFAGWMSQIPVAVVTDAQVGLRGALALANEID